jgi:tetraacyldisaccharide 4'-kinase
MNPRLFIQGLLHSGAQRESLGRKTLLFPLFLLSLLYALIIRWRRDLYRRGILPSSALPCPVVSVGNITLGGTG